MTDMLANAATWLNAQRASKLSQTVTFTTDDGEVSVSATPGSTDYEVDDDNGLTLEAKSQDWIVAAADLVINDEQVEPQPGNRITSAAGETFQVLPLGALGHFRRCDPAGTMLRIHTKLITLEESS